jgi:hypothetical protein
VFVAKMCYITMICSKNIEVLVMCTVVSFEFRHVLLDTYYALSKQYAMPWLNQPAPDITNTQLLFELSRLMRSIVEKRVPEALHTTYDTVVRNYLEIMDRDTGSDVSEDDVFSTLFKVFQRIMQVGGDVLTVNDMLQVQDCGVILSYWGANHVHTQALLLQRMGYSITHSWEGRVEDDGFEATSPAVENIHYPRVYQ